jgi:hypothetical protein
MKHLIAGLLCVLLWQNCTLSPISENLFNAVKINAGLPGLKYEKQADRETVILLIRDNLKTIR